MNFILNQIYYSPSEKFSFFYQYLLSRSNKIEFKKSFKDLIQAFFEEINNNYFNYKIEIDIGISILIIYNESNDLELLTKYFAQINQNSKCDIIQIKKNEDFFLALIIKCLNNLLNYEKENKNLIMEIIFIYFIEFRDKNIDILLNNYYKLIIDLFNTEKLYFLNEKYIDDEIFEKIIKYNPEIHNIFKLLNKSENYSSYLKRIDKNFEVIFNAIKGLKSLGGKFEIDCEVSQNDNINDLIKYHQTLIDKQSQKGKYFITFYPILNKYYELYNEYKNLEGLSDLLTMIIIECKKFPKFIRIQNLKPKIISSIRDLLKLKIDYQEITGKVLVKILLKIKEIFIDENIFDVNYKIYIIKYFIDRCKNNDENTIEEYKKNKIFELFKNKNIENNILFNVLKNEEFNKDDNFIDLLPDELDNEELNIISNLINKIIEKDVNYNEDIKEIFYSKLFERKDFLRLLEQIKINDSNCLRILNLIVNHIEKNNNISYEKFVNYIDVNFFINNKFFIKINNISYNIPVFLLNKLKKYDIFKEKLINKLSDFIIDQDTIFNDTKTNRFLLLEDLITNNYFLFKYKENTLLLIEQLIEKRNECTFKDAMKIVNNFYKHYYDNIKIFLINPNQEIILKNFYLNEISSDINYIESLKDVNEVLKRLYAQNYQNDIIKFYNYIEKIEKGKINSKEKYKNEINELRKKHYEKIKTYGNYSKSTIFFNFMVEQENKEKDYDEDIVLEKSKIKFDLLILSLFEEDLSSIKFDNTI